MFHTVTTIPSAQLMLLLLQISAHANVLWPLNSDCFPLKLSLSKRRVYPLLQTAPPLSELVTPINRALGSGWANTSVDISPKTSPLLQHKHI
jgi:hypothetical protein